ncbi:MAG: hypothetical protein ABW175_22375 [Bradyrhizobium sp.]
MKRFLTAATFASVIAVSVPAATVPASAASLQAGVRAVESSQPSEFSSQRRYRRYHGHGYRPYYQPYYYARPTYYRPYPYSVPAPFVFGFGFGPFW